MNLQCCSNDNIFVLLQVDQDEERQLILEQYNKKAELRGRDAIDKLRSDKIIQEYDENKQKIYR